jgi:hypothetical protein
MFGRMTIEPVVRLDRTLDLETAVSALIKIAETVEIDRWIELAASVLLFLRVPGDSESGAVYASLLNDCKFLDLIERPRLWRAGSPWVVLPGTQPEMAV